MKRRLSKEETENALANAGLIKDEAGVWHFGGWSEGGCDTCAELRARIAELENELQEAECEVDRMHNLPPGYGLMKEAREMSARIAKLEKRFNTFADYYLSTSEDPPWSRAVMNLDAKLDHVSNREELITAIDAATDEEGE